MIKVPLLPVAPVDFVDDLRPPRARARVLGRFTFGTPASPRSPGNRGIEAGPRPASLDLSIRAETFWNLLEEAPGSCSDSSAVQRLSSCQGEEAANGDNNTSDRSNTTTTTHVTITSPLLFLLCSHLDVLKLTLSQLRISLHVSSLFELLDC